MLQNFTTNLKTKIAQTRIKSESFWALHFSLDNFLVLDTVGYALHG